MKIGFFHTISPESRYLGSQGFIKKGPCSKKSFNKEGEGRWTICALSHSIVKPFLIIFTEDIFPPSSPFYGKNALLVRLSGSFSRLDTFHKKTCTSLEINEVILCQPTLRTYYLEKKSIDLVPVELNFQKAKR